MENKKPCLINWIFIATAFFVFIILTVIVLFVPQIKIYDTCVLKTVQSLLFFYPVSFANWISNFGGQYCLFWPQLTAVSVLFSHKKYWSGILLVIFTQFAWHFGDFLKEIFGRERPCGNLYYGSSFPSCHAVTQMCFQGILIYLILRYVKNKFWKYFLISVFSSIILLVSMARLKLNVHFPTDVLAGLTFGFMLVNLYIIIERKLSE